VILQAYTNVSNSTTMTDFRFYVGSYTPTFRDNLSAPCSSFKQSVNNYQSTRYNIAFKLEPKPEVTPVHLPSFQSVQHTLQPDVLFLTKEAAGCSRNVVHGVRTSKDHQVSYYCQTVVETNCHVCMCVRVHVAPVCHVFGSTKTG
jgi:hypothetical protein